MFRNDLRDSTDSISFACNEVLELEALQHIFSPETEPAKTDNCTVASLLHLLLNSQLRKNNLNSEIFSIEPSFAKYTLPEQ